MRLLLGTKDKVLQAKVESQVFKTEPIKSRACNGYVVLF